MDTLLARFPKCGMQVRVTLSAPHPTTFELRQRCHPEKAYTTKCDDTEMGYMMWKRLLAGGIWFSVHLVCYIDVQTTKMSSITSI
jgi:hypothetical protein